MTNYTEANIDAIGLLLIIMAAAVILWKLGRKPKKFSTMLFALLASIIFMCALGPRLFIWWPKGQPGYQIIIPGLCLFLILMFIDSSILKVSAVVILFTASLALGRHYNDLLYTGLYTGNPDLPQFVSEPRRTALIEDLLDEAKSNDKKYPPGWLQDLLIHPRNKGVKNVINSVKKRRIRRIIIVRLWHSWLTGLYGKADGGPLGVWFPGGTLKESADKIEFRLISTASRPTGDMRTLIFAKVVAPAAYAPRYAANK